MTAIVAAGVAATTVSRRRSTGTGDPALVAYLREHLGGADLAIQIVERLRRTQADRDERQLFAWLYEELEADREVVRTLLHSLGWSSRSPKRLVGKATGAVLKVMTGGSSGDLSLFRTLEALAIGVQGKRCMWRALQSLSLPLPAGKSFAELEFAAIHQWEAIDERRRSLVPRTFMSANGAAAH
jgi:hypothetical protein